MKSVSRDRVQELIDTSPKAVFKAFDNCTIVAVQLPNGYVVVETSGCLNPENYNQKIGVRNALKKMVNKIWALEGYAASSKNKKK